MWIENDEWVMKVQKAIIEGLKITLILQIIEKTLTYKVINEMLS